MSEHEGVPERFHRHLDRIDEAWRARRAAMDDRLRRHVPLVDDEVEKLDKELKDAEAALADAIGT